MQKLGDQIKPTIPAAPFGQWDISNRKSQRETTPTAVQINWDVAFTRLQENAKPNSKHYLSKLNDLGVQTIYVAPNGAISPLEAIADHLNIAYPAHCNAAGFRKLIASRLARTSKTNSQTLLAINTAKTNATVSNELQQLISLAEQPNISVLLFATETDVQLGRKLSTVMNLSIGDSPVGEEIALAIDHHSERYFWWTPSTKALMLFALGLSTAILFWLNFPKIEASTVNQAIPSHGAEQVLTAAEERVSSRNQQLNITKPQTPAGETKHSDAKTPKGAVLKEIQEPSAGRANKFTATPRLTHRIQLITLSKRASVDRFLQRHKSSGPMTVTEKKTANSTRYAISLGNFSDYASANAAISELPTALRELKPFATRTPHPNE